MRRALITTAFGLGGLLGPANGAEIHVVNGLNGEDLAPGGAATIDALIEGPGSAGCDGTIELGESRLIEDQLAGVYDVTVFVPDPALDKCEGDVLVTGGGHVSASETAIFIAHLDQSGSPLISKFTANVDPVAAENESRATPHHAAEAPQLDIRYREVGAQSRVPGVGAKGLRNGDQGFPDILPGGQQYQVLVSETPRIRQGFKPPGTDPRFLLAEGSSSLFFVVGSLPKGTLDVIQVVLEVGSTP